MLTVLIVTSLVIVVLFGLIIRSNQIDDRNRQKKRFVNKLKNPDRGSLHDTWETTIEALIK